jgi:hypothetical protein
VRYDPYRRQRVNIRAFVGIKVAAGVRATGAACRATESAGPKSRRNMSS